MIKKRLDGWRVEEDTPFKMLLQWSRQKIMLELGDVTGSGKTQLVWEYNLTGELAGCAGVGREVSEREASWKTLRFAVVLVLSEC